MTSKDIDKALREHYKNNNRYLVSNVYAYDHHYKETDFLIVKDNGYCFDCEIKISRNDFKNDFKKKKHEILEKGYVIYNRNYVRKENDKLVKYKAGEKVPIKRPNRFYFVVPENLIKLEEIPSYAGLLYIREDFKIIKIKEAPLLHKNKYLAEMEQILCRKFYYSYLKIKNFN